MLTDKHADSLIHLVYIFVCVSMELLVSVFVDKQNKNNIKQCEFLVLIIVSICSFYCLEF